MTQATEFNDAEISAEALRLWEESGSPLWGNPLDHWFRAIDRLRERASASEANAADSRSLGRPDTFGSEVEAAGG